MHAAQIACAAERREAAGRLLKSSHDEEDNHDQTVADLMGALGSAYAQPLIDVVVERERIAREIARVEDEIAKFKSLELAA